MSELIRRVRRNLELHQLLPPDRRVLVAVSGGLDSMVLLAALREVADAGDLTLTVAHAHHQLRGPDSDADEALVIATARAAGLPIQTGRLAVREALRRTQESLEMAARRLRHRFLAQTAAQAGIGTIALAHHADDQAELILLRLLRGAGGEGLGGMGWFDSSPVEPSIRLIRPLLDFPKEELHRFAAAKGVKFRDDASNQDWGILRNRVRQELLPYLEREYHPALRQVLQRTAQIVGAEADFVASEARKWRQAVRPRPFERLPVALQRAVIRQQLWDLGCEANFDRVERLRVTSSPETIGSSLTVQRRQTGLVRVQRLKIAPFDFQSGQVKVCFTPKMNPIHFEGVTLTGRISPFRAIPEKARPGEETLDAKLVGSRVVIRHWLPGDRFQPLGASKSSKLQDLFVNRKVPRARRRAALLGVVKSGEIFWVEGLPPGDRFKVTPLTRRVLTLKWRRQS